MVAAQRTGGAASRVPLRAVPRNDEVQQAAWDAEVATYLQTHDQKLLAHIVEEHLIYVRKIIAKVANVAPSVLDTEDLVSSGVLGLLTAINKYDPSRGMSFRSWAFKHIYGRAQDAVRSASPTARSRNVQWTTLEDVYAASEDDGFSEVGLSDKASLAIREAMLGLPLRQAMVLLLGVNKLPIAQIALILDVSVSQVNQDRANALLAMRPKLMEYMSEIT